MTERNRLYDDLHNQVQDNTIKTPVLQFTRVAYGHFIAELALAGKDNEDYVVHFYLPEGRKNGPELRKYWLETFPDVLNETAVSYFGVAERLKAAYTEEAVSWWFRAYGFASEGLDPVLRITRFFEKLDQVFDAGNAPHTS